MQLLSRYLELLPEIFQSSNTGFFLNGYLKIFERILDGKGYLFSFSNSEKTSLNNEEITDSLQKIFLQNNVTLPPQASVKVSVIDQSWILSDTSPIFYIQEKDSEIWVLPAGQKGIVEILDVVADLFHPRFSFLFSQQVQEIIPLQKEAQNLFSNYFHKKFDLLQLQQFLHEYLEWLASWIALFLKKDWSESKKRQAIAEMIPWYRMRGTLHGLRKHLKLYVDLNPDEELWISDSTEKEVLQIGKTSIIGKNTRLGVKRYHFDVYLKLTSFAPQRIHQTVADTKQIIELEKPAHTRYQLHLKIPTIQVGKNSTIGKDCLLGNYELR